MIRVVDRGGRIKQARRECMNRGRWKLFCFGHPFGEGSIRDITKYIAING